MTAPLHPFSGLASLKFHHVGIAVGQMEQGIKALQKSLGAEVSDPVYDPGQGVHLCLAQIGDSFIELVAGPKVERYVKSGPGFLIYHICYQLPDFDAKIIEFATRPGVIQVSAPLPTPVFEGKRVVFFYVEGVGLIEFLEAQ